MRWNAIVMVVKDLPTTFQTSMDKRFIKTLFQMTKGILGPKFAPNTIPSTIHPMIYILKVPVYATVLKIHIDKGATRLRYITHDDTPSPEPVFRRRSELTKEPVFDTFDIRPEL